MFAAGAMAPALTIWQELESNKLQSVTRLLP